MHYYNPKSKQILLLCQISFCVLVHGNLEVSVWTNFIQIRQDFVHYLKICKDIQILFNSYFDHFDVWNDILCNFVIINRYITKQVFSTFIYKLTIAKNQPSHHEFYIYISYGTLNWNNSYNALRSLFCLSWCCFHVTYFSIFLYFISQIWINHALNLS